MPRTRGVRTWMFTRRNDRVLTPIDQDVSRQQ